MNKEDLQELLEKVLADIEANPSKPKPPYKHSYLEHVSAWLASKVIHNAESLGEPLVQWIAAKGKIFIDKQLYREQVVLELPAPEAFAEKDKRIRKEFGMFDSSKFLDVLYNMTDFCREFADYGDRNMMELRLRKGDTFMIAAYFFKPVFYWDLFRSLFSK